MIVLQKTFIYYKQLYLKLLICFSCLYVHMAWLLSVPVKY